MSKFSHKLIKAFWGIDVDGLNHEITRLKLENSRISELLKNTSKEYNTLNEEHKKAKERISEYCSSNENNIIELETYKQKIDSLNEEIASLKNGVTEEKTKFDSLKKEHDEVISENARLKNEQKTSESNISELNDKIKVLQEGNETLLKEKENISKEKENLQNQNSALQNEKNEISVKLNELTAKNSELSEDLEKINAKNSKLDMENQKLTAEKDSLNINLSQLNEEKASLQNELGKLKKVLEDLVKEKDTVLDENKKIKEDILFSKKEIERLNSELKEKERQNETAIITSNNVPQAAEAITEVVAAEAATEEEGNKENTESDITDEEIDKEKLNSEIVSLVKKYDYVRVTTDKGNQYIYQSKHLYVKSGLFDWGIEGEEIITKEILYLSNERIAKLEGMESPYDSEELKCDLSNEETAHEVIESLLTAICTYQPVQINYHDKNGRTTTKNLYYISFKPSSDKFTLPYKNVFKDILEENVDTEQISAITPNSAEPKNFAIAQIETIRRYNAYFTTEEGIKTMKEGIELAQKADQQELVDILSEKLPK